MVVVIMGAIFLASGEDVLVLIDLFIFVVLRWVHILGSTPRLGYGFSSRFPQITPNIVTRVNKLGIG